MKKYILSLTMAVLVTVITGCTQSSSSSSSSSTENVAWLPQNKPLSLSGSEADKVQGTNYVLIFDDSGSMANGSGNGDSKFNGAKAAVNSFFGSIGATDTVAIISLNHGSVEGLQASKEFLKRLSPDGGTPLGAALNTAHRYMQKKIHENSGYGNYVVIALTDGDSSDDVSGPLMALYEEANADIIVKTIGFQISSNNVLNSNITQYFSANSAADLKKVFSSIQAESEGFEDAASF